MKCSSKLTKREKEIIRLVAQGMTDKQIAAELGGLSYRTVTKHVFNAMRKLSAHSRAHAVFLTYARS